MSGMLKLYGEEDYEHNCAVFRFFMMQKNHNGRQQREII